LIAESTQNKYNLVDFFNSKIGKNMGFLTGKRILVTGLASNRSIAYGIAYNRA